MWTSPEHPCHDSFKFVEVGILIFVPYVYDTASPTRGATTYPYPYSLSFHRNTSSPPILKHRSRGKRLYFDSLTRHFAYRRSQVESLKSQAESFQMQRKTLFIWSLQRATASQKRQHGSRWTRAQKQNQAISYIHKGVENGFYQLEGWEEECSSKNGGRFLLQWGITGVWTQDPYFLL